MIKDYLNQLKTTGGYSWAEIANLSGIPEATVRKVFSGETADPRFETVAKIVTAMGGSLGDAVNSKEGKDIEMNAILALKEAYEDRIKDIKEHIASLSKDKRILAITAGSLMIVMLGVLIADLSLGSFGWVRY